MSAPKAKTRTRVTAPKKSVKVAAAPALPAQKSGGDFDIVNQILNHRLRHHDIQRILGTLSRADKSHFFSTIADILAKVAALLEISNRLTDSLSLDNLLMLMVQITTESIEADRGTLFLIDPEADELFSRVAQGEAVAEIRFPRSQGIAGAVVTTGQPVIIADAYADPRFNRAIDVKTGYRTRNIICAPVKSRHGVVIGALQLLNKREGDFTQDDLKLLEAITSQASSALQNAQLFDQVQRARAEETHLLEVTTAISSELQLKPLLMKIMETTKAILDADRSTLFLHDDKTNELWSQVALGLDNREIRFPAHVGIAGTVFSTGETVNIPDAYADPRFNPDVDKKTGYLTRSILCMPVQTRAGKIIGVTQVLNKRDGPFSRYDEKRLRAFSAQAAIALENAKLFEEVLDMKNYNESILESMNNGVLTCNRAGLVEKCNAAAIKILGLPAQSMVGMHMNRLFIAPNEWVGERIQVVMERGLPDLAMDAELVLHEQQRRISANMTMVPLLSTKQESLGAMLVFDDITSEKRLRGTLSRYMTREVAEKLAESEAQLGGEMREVTVLFSDIRHFTTISEHIGPQETVSMLNEYFTIMVDIVFANGGILDKFIGDAMLAVFGAPFSTGEDADRALQTAIEMHRALNALNHRRQAEGKERIAIGVGINTDAVLVGNIGSMKRMDYTVIGDGVNLASRLEGANKYYGTSILTTEATVAHLKHSYLTRDVDLIRVKGKEKPVAICEILDHHSDETFPRMHDVLHLFGEGLAHYRDRNWQRAAHSFGEAVAICPADELSRRYLDRCEQFLRQPPAADWDGVFTMTSK